MNNGRSLDTARLIQLVHRECVMVAPPANGAAFTPFYIPHMPMSQVCWISSLAQFFHQKQARGIALNLMLDCKTHQWLEPDIPHQRCAADGAQWTVRSEDYQHQPDVYRIAGSFQSGTAADRETIATRLPPFDGLHCYLQIGSREWLKHWFVRISGQLQPVAPEQVLVDDWLETLQANRDRLLIEHEGG